MKKILWSAGMLALLLVASGVASLAGDHAFTGPDKCKMCHKVEHTSWALTKHAKAWDTLKPADQADTKCMSCHSTKLPEFKGVSCEACHGAGGDYWKMSVMKDKNLAMQNGLIVPDEKVCIKCHNKNSPTFKGFNFAEAKTKVHDVKKK